MNKLHTIPAADGFRMPGEFESHRGCIMKLELRREKSERGI